MEFRIADTFTDSLARLNGDEQKAVKTTAFDLQINPANPGMSFHKLENARDSGPDPFVLETYEPMMNQLGVKVDDARANLLRLIAAQRAAARRDDLESVRAKLEELRETFPPTPDYDSSERMIYGCGYDVGLIDIKRHIDAELAKEAE